MPVLREGRLRLLLCEFALIGQSNGIRVAGLSVDTKQIIDDPFKPLHAGALLLLTILVLAVLGVTGGLQPWVTPDTEGYLAHQAWPAMLAVERPPFYRWLNALLTFGGALPGLLAVAQIGLYLCASAWLLYCLSKLGMPGRALLAVGISLVLANALFLMGNWVHPEFPAIACALCALGATLRVMQGRRLVWGLLAFAVFAGGAAYLLRPSFLPLIVALPALGLFWRLASWQPPKIGRALLVALLMALPFLTVSSMRLAVVRDFNVVSFGGFQMSGLAALALAPEVLPRLPPAALPLAEQVLAARSAAEAEGRLIGVPSNSSGNRSFMSAALGYFDVLARTHDDVLYGIMLTHRQPGEDWVAFNARLQGWSVQVILASPERYAAWVFGASTRLAGRMLITNLPLALGLIAFTLVVPVLWLRWLRLTPRQPVPGTPDPAAALCLLAMGWLAATGPLIVLTTFPATRYIDTAALLLAAPVWFLVLERIALLRAHPGSSDSR